MEQPKRYAPLNLKVMFFKKMLIKEIPGCFYDDPEMLAKDLDEVEIMTESEASNKWWSL